MIARGEKPAGEGVADTAAPAAERSAGSRGGGRNDRVASGTLKGLHKDAVSDSKVRPEVLEEIIRSNPNDPGIRQALDKQLGDRVEAERRRVRTEERAAIREGETQRAAQSRWSGRWSRGCGKRLPRRVPKPGPKC